MGRCLFFKTLHALCPQNVGIRFLVRCHMYSRSLSKRHAYIILGQLLRLADLSFPFWCVILDASFFLAFDLEAQEFGRTLGSRMHMRQVGCALSDLDVFQK